MTNYTFIDDNGSLGAIALLHIAPELQKMWCKLIPSKQEYIDKVFEYGNQLNDLLPAIKNKTVDRESADKLNIQYNDAVRNLRKDIFGKHYMKIEGFTYEIGLQKDAVYIRLNMDAARGESEAFYSLIKDTPGYKEEVPNYILPKTNKDKIKGENKNGKDNNNSDQG